MSVPKSILEIDVEVLRLFRRNGELLQALDVFMPMDFNDMQVLKNLPDEETVKIQVRGDRLKKAIAIWENER